MKVTQQQDTDKFLRWLMPVAAVVVLLAILAPTLKKYVR